MYMHSYCKAGMLQISNMTIEFIIPSPETPNFQ